MLAVGHRGTNMTGLFIEEIFIKCCQCIMTLAPIHGSLYSDPAYSFSIIYSVMQM